MKITHSDPGLSLKFQWTSISCASNSQRTNRHDNGNAQSKEGIPRSRFLHAACLQGHHLYILGGKDRYSPLKDMWKLDTVSGTWEQIKNIDTTFPHLQGHSMTTYKTQLLIFGGTFYDSDDTPLWIYHTDLNHLRKYSREAGCIAPVGRREHSAVIYKNSMYIYGGFLDNSGSTDEFWAFKIQEEEWRLIHRHKPGKRHGHVAVVLGNNMWLHGGMKGLMALSDLWVFNFAMCTWNKVKGIGTSPTLSNHTAHVVNDFLLLLGGSRLGSPTQDVWTFKFETSTWRQINLNYGDTYPPISLHCSVLLTSSVTAEIGSDRTKSVPRLKGKSIGMDLDIIRPWTSSAVSSGESALPYETNTAHLPSHQKVNILRLDTFGASLDNNNNKSEERINIDPSHSGLEGETSFGGRPVDDCPRTRNIDIWHGDTNVNPTSPGDPSILAQQDILTRARIGSGAGEHCDDEQPLLQRFHSVVSDADLGENNLTLTLSSEDIHGPEMLRKTMSCHAGSLHESVNPAVVRDHVFNEASQDRAQNEQHFTERDSAKWATVTQNNSMEMKTFRCHSRTKQIWNSPTDNCSISGDQVASKQNSSFRLGLFEDVKFVNPTYEVLFESEFNQDTDISEDTSTGQATGAIKQIQPLQQCNKHSFLPWTEQDNIPPTSNCLNDLIVEDLETCDMGQLFQYTEISYPSSRSRSQSSVKSLNATDLISHEDLICAPTPEKHRRHIRSCGNLTGLDSESPEHDMLVRKLSSQEKLLRNNSCSDLISATEKPKQTVGKYLKHAKLGPGRSTSHLHKSRHDSRNVIDSAKVGHIAMQSTGTQTTGSQTSLGNSMSSMTPAQAVPKYYHFITNTPAGSQECGHQLTASAERQQPESGAARNFLLGNSELCIVIIGGQTEHASFHREPLKIWRCTVY